MKTATISLCVLAGLASLWFVIHELTKKGSTLRGEIIARARVSDGDLSQLQRVLAKSRRGEPLTIGFIGGSITRGEGASSPGRQYAQLVTQWWMTRFPNSNVTLINAGVAGTNSTYGCLRVQRDLISRHPDLVVVEFGVNDKDDLDHAQTYEGVIRQLIADPEQPAVVLLFLMHHDGTSAQDFESQIGRRYRLPMISYPDALWPEIAVGRLKFSDITADAIHPNDRGHAAIAAFIDALFQDALDHLPADAKVPALKLNPLPPPRFTDLFGHARLINADEIQPVASSGWEFDPDHHCYRSDIPGSTIDFQLTAQAIDLLYEKMDGGYGTASVSVDGGPPLTTDSWLNGSWGPLCQTDPILQTSQPGLHRVRITLQNEKNALSTGHEFRILGFGIAGPPG